MTKASAFTSILLLFVLLFSGCKQAELAKPTTDDPTEISPAEKELAQKEIAGRIEEIIQGCKQLDVDMALKPYSNSAGFRIVNPDGSITGFSAMKNNESAFFQSVKFLLFTTTKEEFKFLSRSLVLCTWEGRNEFALKSGEQMKTDPYVGSMLFSKTGNEWQIIYAHESSAQPVKVKALE